MSLLPVEFPTGSVTFDLTDDAERFIVGAIQRFHTEHRRLYRVLAMRRMEGVVEGKRRRLVLQAVRYQDGAAKRPKWQVMAWDIDGPGIRFYPRPTRAAMLELFRSFAVTD